MSDEHEFKLTLRTEAERFKYLQTKLTRAFGTALVNMPKFGESQMILMLSVIEKLNHDVNPEEE